MMVEAENRVQRTASRVLPFLLRFTVRLCHRRKTRSFQVKACAGQGELRPLQPPHLRAVCSPRPSPRPPWPPIDQKKKLETPTFSTTGLHSLPCQSREQGLGTKGGTSLPHEENPITWNSANSSQFTLPLGAAILDKLEDPAAGQSPRSRGVRGAAWQKKKKKIRARALKAGIVFFPAHVHLNPITLLSCFSLQSL
jgi:hypothetical protein